MPNGGWGIAGITFNKILKAGCIISGCVGKFWSKCRLTVSPFHNPANNSNSLFIPFISAADQGHFSVPMWSATIASITLFVTSWLVSVLELLKQQPLPFIQLKALKIFILHKDFVHKTVRRESNKISGNYLRYLAKTTTTTNQKNVQLFTYLHSYLVSRLLLNQWQMAKK